MCPRKICDVRTDPESYRARRPIVLAGAPTRQEQTRNHCGRSPVRCLVTGCAGFIGSHLTERLLREGHDVLGVDSFTDYYPRVFKERNIADVRSASGFKLIEGELTAMPLESLLEGIEVVFHQAAPAGVRASWGSEFCTYTRLNVPETQQLLEACRKSPSLRRFVYASSSSVYGNARALPVSEDATLHPVSPYGVTKLAGEHLCLMYYTNFGVPGVTLRYFTVYGARQRPDMAFHRFIQAAMRDESITVHEDGNQTRDFTHVSDVVEVNIKAATRERAVGRVYNVAGGSRVTLYDALDELSKAVDLELHVVHAPKQAGDVRDTYADISRAKQELGYSPTVSLRGGLRDEVDWYKDEVMAGAGSIGRE